MADLHDTARNAFVKEMRIYRDRMDSVLRDFDSGNDDAGTKAVIELFDEISAKHQMTKRLSVINQLTGGRLIDNLRHDFENGLIDRFPPPSSGDVRAN